MKIRIGAGKRRICERHRLRLAVRNLRAPPRAPYRTKGSIPTARWIALNEKAPTFGAFAEPSDGLEPSTPSLPWRCSTN